MRIGWKSLAPIFASVVISPWNLLVGGLLIQHLSFIHTIEVLLIGYGILGLLFVLYGGLGYKERKQSAQILSEVFPLQFVKYIVPLILAAGQIGWAAINIELGGKSLGVLSGMPSLLGIVVYGILLTFFANLRLKDLGFVKSGIVAASIGLVSYIVMQKMMHFPSYAFFARPVEEYSLFWGVSVVVASLISFATVTPDFFKDAKAKKDVIFSTFFGALIPGFLTAFCGAILFSARTNLDLIALISTASFAFFPHIFNVVTNTDGAIAVYTPGLKFQGLFKIPLRWGVMLAGVMAIVLAACSISSHLEIWLTFLSLFFPAFIGITFPAVLFKRLIKKPLYRQNIVIAFITSVVIAMFLISVFPPVLVSLLAPLIIFTVSLSYNNISVFSL